MFPELQIITDNPNISHWSLDNGYESKTVLENEYPNRVFSRKSKTLTMDILHLDSDAGSHCGEGDGFNVALTIPGDTVKRLDLIYIEMNQMVYILIKPKLIITSEKLRSYSPNERQCFFDSERRLRFFKIYTQNNCETECLANYTKQECGCTRYSFPSMQKIIFKFIIQSQIEV